MTRLKINLENISDLHKMLEFIDKSKFTILPADNNKTMSLGYLIFDQEANGTELICVAPIYDSMKECEQHVCFSQEDWLIKLRKFELETESVVRISNDERKLLLGFSVYPEREIYYISIDGKTDKICTDSVYLSVKKRCDQENLLSTLKRARLYNPELSL